MLIFVRSEGTHLVMNAYSEQFKVVPLKEFRGLKESTHLSRTFSDQGVRLRLRKEARTLAGYVAHPSDHQLDLTTNKGEAVMGQPYRRLGTLYLPYSLRDTPRSTRLRLCHDGLQDQAYTS